MFFISSGLVVFQIRHKSRTGFTLIPIFVGERMFLAGKERFYPVLPAGQE
jgi:hypothetical protein